MINMKKIYLCLLPFLLVLVSFIGCGGNKAIKGIMERELGLPKGPPSEEINPRAYNHFANASIMEALMEYSLANREYAKALEYYPNSNELRYSYAMTYWKLYNFRRALEEAIKISPKDARVLILIGNCYAGLRMPDSSIAAFRLSATLDSSNSQVFYRLGEYYRDRQLIDSAIWAYKHITRLLPTAGAFRELGNLQISSNLTDDAIASFKESLRLDGTADNVRSHLGLALAYEKKQDRDSTGLYLEKAAELAPYDMVILNQLLEYYRLNDSFAKAIEIGKSLAHLAPNDNDIARRLALLYIEADSLMQADSIFNILIDAGDDNFGTLFYSGRIAMINNNYSRAAERFNEALLYVDSIPEIWLDLGAAYRFQDSIEVALTVFDSGLTYMVSPGDSTTLMFGKAVTLERNGQFEEASGIFEKIIELSPDNDQALNYLGYMLAEEGVRLEYARGLIRRALDIEPENGAYLDSYGWVLHKLGDYREALEYLLRAYELMPDDPVIVEHIGYVYEALGDMAKANEFWKAALDLDPENESLKEKLEQ